MKKVYLILFLAFFISNAFAQTTISLKTSGFWDVATNWNPENVPDQISEDVAFNNSTTTTIRNNSTYSVGSVNLNNQNTLTIEAGSRLNVGSASANKIFTTDNNAILYVYGDLYIYGDLVVNNNLKLVVTGNMVVTGDIILNNNSSVDVSGSLTVEGSLIGGNNTDMNVDGTVTIGENISVGPNSSLTGSGTVNVNGTCTDDGSGSFCQSGPLPVTLLYFNATAQSNAVELNWAASKAWDFSHYELERSANGKTFGKIATIDAEENTDYTTEFTYTDRQPISGTSYYRLKAVDIDGKFEYKGIQAVQFVGQHFQVYPNPATNGILKITSPQAAEGVRLVLRDQAGRAVRSIQMSGQEEAIDTSGLPEGLYILSIQSVQQTVQSQVYIR